MKRFQLAAVALLASASISLAAPEIGKPAPDFTLKDTSGKDVSLSDFKGKTVVLEWVNFGCPFVKKHYGAGNMQALQKDAAAKGVAWLSICSSGPEKQGNFSPADAAAKCKETGWAGTAYLIDETGKTGSAYGAKTTPEIFIVNPEGTLVYSGAIDDITSPDPGTIKCAKNYVTEALGEILAGKPVSAPSTKSYGCSVKYP